MHCKSKIISLKDILKILKNEKLYEKIIMPSSMSKDINFSGLVTDSKSLKENASENNEKIFVCIRGMKVDSHDLIEVVFQSGIVCFIVEEDKNIDNLNIYQILVNDSRRTTAVLAAAFFDYPTNKFTLIGITGTNGKSTASYMAYRLLLSKGFKTGLIGTLGYFINEDHFSTDLTTPDVMDLNKIFIEMINSKIEYVIMEVSSHAISQSRTYGLNYDIALFTNLSRDHLDFHKTMENYAYAKFSFLESAASKGAKIIINFGEMTRDTVQNFKIVKKGDFLKEKLYSHDLSIIPYLFFEKLKENSDVIIHQKDESIDLSFLKLNKSNSLFIIMNILDSLPEQSFIFSDLNNTMSNKYKVFSNVLGYYNAYNLTSALAIVYNIFGSLQNYHDIYSTDSKEHNILNFKKYDFLLPGRLEQVENNLKINCFIDFAHTPDALRNVLSVLTQLNKKQIKKGRIICVFGAGGNRDKGKRPEMVEVSQQNSDLTIITSDNPRYENPKSILFDIVEKTIDKNCILIVLSREEAINKAVLLANEGDTILISGKGHENYQDIKGVKYRFSDREVVTKAFDNKKKLLNQLKKDTPELNYHLDEKYSNTTIELAMELELTYLEFVFKNPKHLFLQSNCSENFKISNISTDTRTIKDKSLYFALIGDKFNGHDFIVDALRYENNVAVVQKESWMTFYDKHESDINKLKSYENRIIIVEDTTEALADLASKYRHFFNLDIIAITGSFGKTTTKEIIYNILKNCDHTMKSYANENNIVGLSKTLFNIQPWHKYGVIEIGTNKPGEIEKLSKLLKPNLALITSIGPSHLEFFGSIESIYIEKLKLFEEDLGLRLTIYDPSIEKYSNKEITYVGECEKCSYKYEVKETKENEIEIIINNEVFKIEHNQKVFVNNYALALSLAKNLGLMKETIEEGISKKPDIKNRMEIIETDNKKLIFDCYNANPQSMIAALDFWSETDEFVAHVAILGDMLELGYQAEYFHLQIANHLKEINLKRDLRAIITVGKFSKFYTEYLEQDKCLHFESIEKLTSYDLKFVIPVNCVILIKGSNGIGLEKIKGKIE